MRRRDVLRLAGAGGLAALLGRAWGDTPAAPTSEYFIFIHAAGGWDVMLWADPRNTRTGVIEPPHSGNCDLAGLRRFRPAALAPGLRTFEILSSARGDLRLGPAIGDLDDLRDRLTIINGLAMNTVSHDDGATFSITGRHHRGGTVPASSIDVMIASELGPAQHMPAVSIRFPSWYVGPGLDPRAVPLRVGSVGAVTRAFSRGSGYLDDADRGAIEAVLGAEVGELAASSGHAPIHEQLVTNYAALPALVTPDLSRAFEAGELRARYPRFNYRSPYGEKIMAAPFAVEAIRRDLVRSVAFSLGGLDTHDASYRQHARRLQDLFDAVAALVKTLDTVPHPHLTSTTLGAHTHILVVSEFCRTPQVNPRGGRDHYPNNSALVISPRFRAGRMFGRTDLEQLLPTDFGQFTDGKRAIAPPDLLATLLGAFAIDPRRHMRDGDVVKSLLA